MRELPANPLHVSTLPDVDSSRLRASHSNLWASPHRTCLTCGFERRDPNMPEEDRTFIWYDLEDGNDTEVYTYQCACVDQWIMYRWLLMHGIPKNYQRIGWRDATDVPDEVKDQVKRYLTYSERYVDRGMNVILESTNTGTGKSMMMYLLAKGLLYAGHDVYVAQMNEIVEMYTSGWRSEEEKKYFEKRIMNASVLGIDDLGKEQNDGKSVDFIVKLIDRVIRHRTANSRPTIITTNLAGSDRDTGYGRFIQSLLSETAIKVPVDGPDFRAKMRERSMTEIENGYQRPLVWR